MEQKLSQELGMVACYFPWNCEANNETAMASRGSIIMCNLESRSTWYDEGDRSVEFYMLTNIYIHAWSHRRGHVRLILYDSPSNMLYGRLSWSPRYSDITIWSDSLTTHASYLEGDWWLYSFLHQRPCNILWIHAVQPSDGNCVDLDRSDYSHQSGKKIV